MWLDVTDGDLAHESSLRKGGRGLGNDMCVYIYIYIRIFGSFSLEKSRFHGSNLKSVFFFRSIGLVDIYPHISQLILTISSSLSLSPLNCPSLVQISRAMSSSSTSASSKNNKYHQQAYSQHPFLLAPVELFGNTDAETGLSALQAREAQKYGPNRLQGDGAVRWYSVLLKQVCNAMILVCMGAGFWIVCVWVFW